MAIDELTPPPEKLATRLLAIPVQQNRVIDDHSVTAVRSTISRLKKQHAGVDFLTRAAGKAVRVWRVS